MLTFLIPYYNHPESICKLVESLKQYNLGIIIVDDGSNLESKNKLKELNFNDKNLHLLVRENNGGKGAAVKDGIIFANSLGYTHTFQIDADMQHNLDKIEIFLKTSRQNPNSLILAKPKYNSDAPKSRLYGRKITNFWVWINTLGGDLPDVMCGMRIYPVCEILPLIYKCRSNRMDFDLDILLLAFKQNLSFLWIEVEVSYKSGGVSHFRGFKDNLLISIMHARHFFLLPFFCFKRLLSSKNTQNLNSINNKSDLKWWNRKERAGVFVLNLTLFLVLILPKFLLEFCIRIVTFFYFLFSKEERKNLGEFYDNLCDFKHKSKLKFFKKQRAIYQNFYNFGLAICDKMAVWLGKITYNELILPNRELMDKELIDAKQGQILLVSHYGNIEIARALSNELKFIDITILVYQKNAEKFLNLINQISKNKLRVLCVDNFNVSHIALLQEILDNGGHIGIMGDRVAMNSNRNSLVSFLGKPCVFPQGAFLIAGLLKSKISLLWCERQGRKYLIELEPLSVENQRIITLGRDKEQTISKFMQEYVKSLEQRVCENPQFWFNFYDFWGQNAKKNL